MALRTNGAEVRRRRELAGITLGEFAALAGYSLNHLSNIELGKANGSLAYQRKTASLLECEIADITSGTAERAKPRRRLALKSAA